MSSTVPFARTASTPARQSKIRIRINLKETKEKWINDTTKFGSLDSDGTEKQVIVNLFEQSSFRLKVCSHQVHFHEEIHNEQDANHQH